MDGSHILLWLARAVHFGACLVLVGGFAVRLFIARAPGERGGGRAAFACLAAAVGSGLVWIWVSAAEMAGTGLMQALDPALLKVVMLETRPGHVWIVRFVIAAVLGLAMCFPRWRYRELAGMVLAASLAGSLVWLGHAGAVGGGVLLCADVLHLVAAGFWPAGLLPFALLVRREIRAGRVMEAHRAVRRFSVMSVAAVALVAGSGFINAWILVGGFHALCATGYGRWLIAKLALFGVALVLGGWNLIVHKPRLEAVPVALESLLAKVWIEASLGGLILPIVAIMGTLPPAASGQG